MESKVKKSINDLGIAAYLFMHGFTVAGRKGKSFIFEVKEADTEEFDRLSFEYLSSPYHQFDSCLMSLKKMGEYSPK